MSNTLDLSDLLSMFNTLLGKNWGCIKNVFIERDEGNYIFVLGVPNF